VKRELILDASSLTAPFQVPNAFGGRAVSYVRYPFWVMTRPEFREAKHPLTARLPGLDLFWPSPLELKAPAGVEASALVKSTPKAWLQKDRFAIGPEDQGRYAADAASTTGQYALVASLSGALPMAYAGKVPPKRAGAAALPPLPASPRPSRVIVVGSADFAYDLMTVTDSNFNASFVVSAADWLSSGDDLVGIKTRGMRDTRLAKVQDPDARSALISFAYLVNLVLVPLGVLAFGLLRNRGRKRLAREEALARGGPGAAAASPGAAASGPGAAAANESAESEGGKR
jgi:ABC-type uncharacterized transport system involved in gliding motility auxiliary subunit